MSTAHLLSGISCAAVFLLSGCNSSEVENIINDAIQEAELEAAAAVEDSNKQNDEIEQLECEIPEKQQQMLDEVNLMRSQAQVCGDESFEATQPLAWDCKLQEAARVHSQDMVDNNFFSHTGSDGLNAGDRITNVGYRWYAYGENLAAGFSNAKDAVQALMESPGHCKNLMNPIFTEFGSAVITTYGNDYTSYWSQEFAQPY